MNRFDIGERKVTGVELFFDLVFVAGAHQVASLLKHAESFGEVLSYLFMFMAVLWIWIGHTSFSTRFESRSLFYHIMTFLTMACGLIMIILFSGALDDYFIPFVWAFAASKLILLLLYFFAIFSQPRKLKFVIPLLASIAVVGVLWLIAPMTAFPLMIIGVAFLIDVLTPIFSQPLLQQVQINTTHYPERLALLTLIMLGEMVIALVASVVDVSIDVQISYLLLVGLLSVSIIFWVYFRLVEQHFMRSVRSNSRVYLYAHLPIFLGLVLLAAGFKGILSYLDTQWLIILGMILFILGLRLLHYVLDQRWKKRQLWAFGIFFVFLIVYYFVSKTDLFYTVLIVVLFIFYLFITEFVLSLYQGQQRVTLTWNQ